MLVRKRPTLKRLWLKTARRVRTRSHRTARRKRHPFRVALFKLALAAVALWGLVAAGYYAWALTFDLAAIREMPQRSVVLDCDGRFYSRLSGENRVVAPFDAISNHFVNALITREDSRFYSHHGVDPIGIARAVVRNFLFGGVREGASTITQQLARNSFPIGGRTLHRKLIEAALAFRIETELTKEQILEAYVNRIYFGSGFYGVDTASRAYFGHPASRLTLSEAALLAGLIRSPTRFSPFNDLPASIRNRDVVLRRMREMGFINSAQLDAALREPVHLAPRPSVAPEENWAMETIRRELALVLPEERIDGGGLKILTTLDPGLQGIAESALAARLAQIERRPGYPHPRKGAAAEVLQGALLAIDNRTGGIRAVVGGRDYTDSKYHRAFDARRPAGSTAKPFVFATAFAHGVKPGDAVSDARLAPGEIPRGLGRYNPANSDNQYGGDIRVADALIHSRNTASVRVGLRAGLGNAADTMERAGLAGNVPVYPSLCLGSFETTLKDLTAAYTAFATDGIRLQPYLIEKITDADGSTLFQSTHGRIRFLDARTAAMTSDILRDVLARGTAANARQLGLCKRAGGKTGTTDRFHDAWFVGFTRSLTCGVWVGFDHPQTILSGGYGADLALPIWVDVIQAANAKNYPD
ncbi:MAG: PBP1A family penicillin-binding protein [Terrimicrobiaceae bacterium]|nr:PBP1A family penicillin-binding protein [Terrimicrobiaceae bacterium]